MKCDPNIDQLDQIFRSDSEGILSSDTKSKLHEKLWSENVSLDPISESNRCICWRYLLCLISPTNKNDWANELNQSVAIYVDMKSTTSPSVINVGLDPLSDENPDILSYFDSLEKVKSIELDLNRLYMSGIDDEYFQTKRRKGILQSVLLLWSVQNPSISYRQGNTLPDILHSILFLIPNAVKLYQKNHRLQIF
jgi:Rab-GTPase-TBC domain